jgi:hypothetical protein
MNNRKRIRLSILLLLFFVLCISPKGISQRVIHVENMGFPLLTATGSKMYMCAQYTVSYSKRVYLRRYKYKYAKREVCSCFSDEMYKLAWYRHFYSETLSICGYNTIIIWDTNFIINYVLPVISDRNERHKMEYTLINSNDSTFTVENIIDLKNKVIINDKMYYYPMNVRTCFLIPNIDYEWFKSIVPKSSWIFYGQDWFDNGRRMQVELLIPLLEEW